MEQPLTGDINMDETGTEFADQSFASKKGRRSSGMCVEELCLISTWYVNHYAVYHNSMSGSSKQEAQTAKKRLLAEISEDLVMRKFSKRTPEQIDQRIRDTIKKAKEKLSEQKKERSKTGGGVPNAIEVPSYIQIVLDHSDNKPRLVGIEGGLEIGTAPPAAVEETIFTTMQNTSGQIDTSNVFSNQENMPSSFSAKQEPGLDLSYFAEAKPLGDSVLNSTFATKMPPPIKVSTPIKNVTPRTATKRPATDQRDYTHEKMKILRMEQDRLQTQSYKDEKEHVLLDLKIENARQKALMLQIKSEYGAKKLEELNSK